MKQGLSLTGPNNVYQGSQQGQGGYLWSSLWVLHWGYIYTLQGLRPIFFAGLRMLPLYQGPYLLEKPDKNVRRVGGASLPYSQALRLSEKRQVSVAPSVSVVGGSSQPYLRVHAFTPGKAWGPSL